MEGERGRPEERVQLAGDLPQAAKSWASVVPTALGRGGVIN